MYPINISSNRCTSYKINNISDDITLENGIVLNFEYLTFPLSTNRIKDFETKNPDINVNVFGLNNNNNIIGPYNYGIKEKSKHVHLVLLEYFIYYY